MVKTVSLTDPVKELTRAQKQTILTISTNHPKLCKKYLLNGICSPDCKLSHKLPTASSNPLPSQSTLPTRPNFQLSLMLSSQAPPMSIPVIPAISVSLSKQCSSSLTSEHPSVKLQTQLHQLRQELHTNREL